MDKTNAVAIAGLSSQKPGVITFAKSVFGLDPKISADVLTKAFQIDNKLVEYLQFIPFYIHEPMSKRGKRKDEEGYASDGEAPPKKASKKDSGDDSDDDNIVICEISKNRRVSVRNWQGKVVVDIREFYVKDGKQLPGKKGPFLSALSNHF
ncbi:ssDNA-binding transcriptional regulator [Actinidia rufa]|uniref:SsDNA-binding transcriptional regulator n=1 Tax=Actinidia rufa TaxID=165716 RepID=A0A7J0ENB2_9ERIC|nr:ssDNA-binding transcriptional regulator [Actinidia rufa]